MGSTTKKLQPFTSSSDIRQLRLFSSKECSAPKAENMTAKTAL
jgi:hypothetical protein